MAKSVPTAGGEPIIKREAGKKTPKPAPRMMFDNLRTVDFTDERTPNEVSEIIGLSPALSDSSQNSPPQTPTHPPTHADTHSLTQVLTPAPTQAGSTPIGFISLDATHTNSEAKIYGYMYRQTISRKIEARCFTIAELSSQTGIRSEHTIRKAVRGLLTKCSIEQLVSEDVYRVGYKYRVLTVKDIFRLRSERGIVINELTKNISRTPADTHAPTQAENAPVPPQLLPDSSLYRNNELNSSDSSSSSLLARSDDRQLVPLDRNHYETVCKIYQNQTGNKWTTDDDDFYKQVQGIAIDHIRAEMRRITEAATRTPGRFKYYAVSLLNEVQKIEPMPLELPLDKQYQRWIDEFNLENDNVWKIPLSVKLDYLQARCEREGVEWNREVAEGLF